MTTSTYFSKFPTILYSNTVALDIISNAQLVERFVNNPYVYYPYELSSDQRADVLAHQYYDDSYFSWLIYYGNKIVDPYHDWYLPDDDFRNSLTIKYGSVENAIKRIAFYRTNWYNDSRQIPQSIFENTFSAADKKYWDTKFNEEIGIVLYYERKKQDVMVNTNRISTYETTNTGELKSGDLIDVIRNTAKIGTAEVIAVTSTSVTIKNVYLIDGDIVPGDGLYSDTNTNNYAVVSSLITNRINIPASEMVYWEAVTYYDYENEKNSAKRTVKLIDNKLAFPVSEALSDAMSE